MKQTLRILVVEDSEDDALLILHQIKNGGYDIEYERVETAETMRAALSEKTWDIVLSDYRMPHFDGLEALAILKESGLDIPFIIISGLIIEETAVEAMKAGARDYVMKNNMRRLLPAIERELRESKNRAEQKLLEQKQIQAEALRVSEEQHRQLFEISMEGIAIAQGDKLCYFNPMMLNITGYSADELLSMDFLDLFPSEDRDKVLTNYRKRLSEENAEQRYQVRIEKKDETLRWVEISGVKFNWKEQPASLAFFNDITEQKLAEEALKSALERSHRQQTVVTTVTLSSQLAAGDVQGLAYQLNGHAAKAVDVERVSVWLFNDGGNELRCVDLYEHSADCHSAGAVLLKNEYKNEFEALRTSKYIDANDPLTDPRTAGYVEGYLKPLGITSMLDVVIREGTRNIGVLCFEHVGKKHNWEPDEITFAIQLADQIGIAILNHERIFAEGALKESEEKYRLLAESSPEMIYLVNTKGYITYLNKVAAAQFRAPVQELVGKHLNDIFPPDLAQQNLGVIQDVITTKNNSQREIEMVFPTGNRWVDSRLTPVFDEKNQVIGVLGLSYDITERKEAEEKINILAHAIKNSADCIAITDKDYKIIFVNESFCKVYGFEKEEIVGQSISVITSRNNLPEVSHSLYSTLAKKEVWAGEVLNKRKDGNDFPVQLSLAPLVSDKGEMIAIVGVLRDITERKRAEAELKSKNEQLLKLNAEKDKFFSIISHDLRSPFSGFLGMTQIMAEELQTLTIDQIQELSESMKSSATNLSRLLENLLQWARMQQGLIPFKPEMIKLNSVVDESIALIVEPAKNKGIDLIFDIPSTITVLADRNMLQTVIRNLVSNAVKFTPKGGKISISAKVAEDKSVEISIKDTGIGMSLAMVDNLFRLDVNTNRTGTEGEPSTGLGLLLCKEFVEKHGGEIRVESEEGNLSAGKAGGTTFCFTLRMST